MKKAKELALDFEIDILTNSIQNRVSGDSFPTEVVLISNAELKQVTTKNGWAFNWKTEVVDSKKQVYKLTIVNNPGVIQGLLSLSVESDHIFMNLVESALSILAKINCMLVLQEI